MNKTPLFALAAVAVAGLLFVYSNQGTQVATDIDLTNAVETVTETGTTAMTVGEDVLLEDIAPSAGDALEAVEETTEEAVEAVEAVEEVLTEDVMVDESDMTEGEDDMTEGDEGSDVEDMPEEDTEGESVH